ncbi:MAG: cyclic nucleotide-binding domain-containing protein [Sulfurisoma sp.]|nr:cyclic nucleotide-binding domain-containing protein [Sulfurisoma sp.]
MARYKNIELDQRLAALRLRVGEALPHDVGHGLYLLTRGIVEVATRIDDEVDWDKRVAVLGPGDAVGVTQFLAPGIAEATEFRAASDVLMHRVEAATLREFCREEPAAGAIILGNLGRMMAQRTAALGSQLRASEI